MWWDERCIAASVAQHAQQQQQQLLAVVDLDCEYVRELVLQSFARRSQWRVAVTEGEDVADAAVRWGEYERIDWEAVHRGALAASCYCIRKGLIRKAHLAHNLKKWNAKHPSALLARSVPETFILDIDDPDYFEEAMCDVPEVRDMEPGSEVWIAKPSITNQAVGVCVFNRVDQLENAVRRCEDLREWVLQRYIERPLLVAGRKFHIRAYVLCIGSLRCFVYSDMLALFAAAEYDSSLSNLDDHASHLTNTCRLNLDQHAAQDDTNPQSNASIAESDVVRLVSELPDLLCGDDVAQRPAIAARCEQMEADVRNVIGECMAAVSGELTFFTLPNCFELFGFDLMVDDSWRVWLLEANAEPDFAQTGGRLKQLVAGLIEGAMQLFMDPLAAAVLPSSPQHVQPTPSSLGHWIPVFERTRSTAAFMAA